MDFLSAAPSDPLPRPYQCLAVITVGANAGSRRGSVVGGEEDGGPLTRILSGGRRRSSVAQEDGGENTLTRVLSRRKSVHTEGEGPWYWRCRVGVTADNLVILPISTPPNPVLKARPPPLSNIVRPTRRLSGHTFGADEVQDTPTHARKNSGGHRPGHINMEGGGGIATISRRLSGRATAEEQAAHAAQQKHRPGHINMEGGGGIASISRRLSGRASAEEQAAHAAQQKHRPGYVPMEGGGGIASLGRRLSAAFIHKPEEHATAAAPAAAPAPAPAPAPRAASPAAAASTGPISNSAATADTGSLPSEMAFPGMIEGQPLAAIVIPLNHVKQGVKMGGKEREGCHVSVGATSAVAGKTGHIRFEFDKDTLGGKAEAELLMNTIVNAIGNAPAAQHDNLQLGHGPHGENNSDWKGDAGGRWG